MEEVMLCIVGFAGIFLGVTVHEVASRIISKYRRRKQYYRYLTKRNLELERKVNFYRLQSEGITVVEVKSLGNAVRRKVY